MAGIFQPTPAQDPQTIEFRFLGGPNIVDAINSGVFSGAQNIVTAIQKKEAGELRETVGELQEQQVDFEARQRSATEAVADSSLQGDPALIQKAVDELAALQLEAQQTGADPASLTRKANLKFRELAAIDSANVPRLLGVFQEFGFSPRTGFPAPGGAGGGGSSLKDAGTEVFNAIIEQKANTAAKINELATLNGGDIAGATRLVGEGVLAAQRAQIAKDNLTLAKIEGELAFDSILLAAPDIAAAEQFSVSGRITGLVNTIIQQSEEGVLTQDAQLELQRAIQEQIALGGQRFFEQSGAAGIQLSSEDASKIANIYKEALTAAGLDILTSPTAGVEQYKSFLALGSTVGIKNASPIFKELVSTGRSLGFDAEEVERLLPDVVLKVGASLEDAYGKVLQVLGELEDFEVPAGTTNLDVLDRILTTNKFAPFLDRNASPGLLAQAGLSTGTVRDVTVELMRQQIGAEVASTQKELQGIQERIFTRGDGSTTSLDRAADQEVVNEFILAQHLLSDPSALIGMVHEGLKGDGVFTTAEMVNAVRTGGFNSSRSIPARSSQNTPLGSILGDTAFDLSLDTTVSAIQATTDFKLTNPVPTGEGVPEEIATAGFADPTTPTVFDSTAIEVPLPPSGTGIRVGEFERATAFGGTTFAGGGSLDTARNGIVSLFANPNATNEDYAKILANPVARQVVIEDGAGQFFSILEKVLVKELGRNFSTSVRNFSLGQIEIEGRPTPLLGFGTLENPDSIVINMEALEGETQGLTLDSGKSITDKQLAILAENGQVLLTFSRLSPGGVPQVFSHRVSSKEVLAGQIDLPKDTVRKTLGGGGGFGGVAPDNARVDSTLSIIKDGDAPLMQLNPDINLASLNVDDMFIVDRDRNGRPVNIRPQPFIALGGQTGVAGDITRAATGARPIAGITGFSTTGLEAAERLNSKIAMARIFFPDGNQFAAWVNGIVAQTNLNARGADTTLKGAVEKGQISLKESRQGRIRLATEGKEVVPSAEELQATLDAEPEVPVNPTRLSDEGKAFTLQNEGFSNTIRKDRNQLTGGFGTSTRFFEPPKKEGDPVTREEADNAFARAEEEFSSKVLNAVEPGKIGSQQEFDALFDLFFQLGSSPKTIALINADASVEEITQEMGRIQQGELSDAEFAAVLDRSDRRSELFLKGRTR